MSRRILVVDSEIAPFGRHEGHSGIDCAAAAGRELLARHAGLAGRVDLIAVGAARMAASDGLGNGLPQLIGERIGLGGIAGLEVHAFCASGNAAIHQAATQILAGRTEVALVLGVEHITAGGPRGPLVPEAGGAEAARGFSPPVFYALCADEYLRTTGATREALAQVSVNNRRHGATNPNARFQAEVTVEEVLASRQIADPLTMLQCCPSADGAGALLLTAEDALDGGAPEGAVELLGWGASSGNPTETSLLSYGEDVRASHTAYEHAGIGPEEIDVAEVHDAFTISQIIHLEDTGLQPRGEAWRHALDPNPRLTVNPSGGLLSRGHPLGATGLAQFDSIRRYLNDKRIEPQRRRYGLIQEAGGLRPSGQLLSECTVLGRV